MLSRSTFRAAVFMIAATLPFSALAEGGIEVRDAYAISAGPAAPTGAAFMVIQNSGGSADRLIAAASPAAERVGLHTHIEDDGVMRMVQVEEGFDLPINGEILLQRGGHHVMFLGLTAAFEDGMMVPLTLTFAVAGDVLVEVPVDLKRMTGDAIGKGHRDNGAMDHGDMGHATGD